MIEEEKEGELPIFADCQLHGDEGIIDDGTRKWQGSFQQFKGIRQMEISARVSGQGVRTHPPMVLSAMVRKIEINQLAFYQIFCVVMMTLGGGWAIITLWAADRNHGSCCDCQKSWEVIVGSDLSSLHSCLFTLQVAERGSWQAVVITWLWGRFAVFFTVGTSSMHISFHREAKNVCEPGSDLFWPVRHCACREVCGKIECEGVPRTQGAVQRWAPVSPAITVQGVSALHPDFSDVYSSEYGPSADGVQHPKLSCSIWTSHCWSLPDSTKGAAKGHVLVKGLWAGLTGHPDRPFAPNQSLKVPGQDKRGKLVEWVEKASFDRLNRLFEIAAPQPYVLNILPRRLPKEVVAGEHFVLPDLPFYAAVQKADARTRKARLNNGRKKEKELLRRLRVANGPSCPPAGAPAKKKKKVSNKGKEVKPPTPPKEFVRPPSTYVKEAFKSVVERLALLAEEHSINQPGSPHPDADAAEASCAAASPLSAHPQGGNGSESKACLLAAKPLPCMVKGPARRRSRSARDLKSGLLGRASDRFLETIEVKLLRSG
ncbi:hypothetical protein CK203_105525 [Vitis vinifera]|uniref:Uncharacterized protein n=1 Tax=Vitis vinifera TaxID=29760 RepID=A0A438FGM1_VITVI|nr:hypothetical protein CK203_105525 [Vitis vinifera]